MGKADTIKTRISKKQRQFIDIYRKTAGNVSYACSEAGISRTTYYDWINKSDTFKQKIEDVLEENHDFVESKLLALIKKDNVSAIQFYLKTKAKHRGYTETQQVRLDENASIKLQFID